MSSDDRIEWTAMLRGVDGRWRAVGTEGTREHAENELRDWARNEELRDSLRLGWRHVTGWLVVSESVPFTSADLPGWGTQ